MQNTECEYISRYCYIYMHAFIKVVCTVHIHVHVHVHVISLLTIICKDIVLVPVPFKMARLDPTR